MVGNPWDIQDIWVSCFTDMATGTRHHVWQCLVGALEGVVCRVVLAVVAGGAGGDIPRISYIRPVSAGAQRIAARIAKEIDIAFGIGTVNGMYPVGEGNAMDAFAIARIMVTSQALIRVKRY